MLSRLNLENFKCFNALSLSCAPLTVLTGFNGGGKSTSLQTILLLAQAIRTGGRSLELPLNGTLAKLGTPGEILKEQSETKVIQFGIETDIVKIIWRLHAENRSEGRSMKIQEIFIETKQKSENYKNLKEINKLLPLALPENHPAHSSIKQLSDTVFLSAVRLGTVEVFPAPEAPEPVHADVGLQGEFAPWWLLQDLNNIDKARCHPSSSSIIPRIQLNAWANELFPGAEFVVDSISKPSLPLSNIVQLAIRIGNTEWRRPANIGYGLTYAFPVLVAGLLAKKGQILIIDSPEAHLHPKGQSSIGRFLAHMAAAGVQIMLETHSDHVLSGIRLAVRDGTIEPGQVATHFFTSDSDSPVTSPQIDKEGNLSEWPEGFFDQSEKDLARLAGWI